MSAPGSTKAGVEMPSPLTLRSLTATLVSVPMRRALGTSAMRITHAPLLLLDLQTEEGPTGRAYLFGYLEAGGRAALEVVRDAAEVLAGHGVAPAEVRRKLEQRFRLIGARGVVAMVMAGIDIACWDVLARAAGQPLARLLGGTLRASPAYNSNGLGLVEPQAAADEALELVAEGFQAIKLRLGRARPEDDLAAVRAVRRAIPDHVALMSDYNQALTRQQALQRCRQLDGEGLYWIEEPVRHDDYAASADLAAALHTPVQIGENFAGPRALAQALQARASDFVMPDLERIGGVSGWLAAAALADVAGIEMSTHLFPEVSVHLLAATPTAHWLEVVDWAAPILQQPPQVVDGLMTPSDRPGNGLDWDLDAVARYRVG